MTCLSAIGDATIRMARSYRLGGLTTKLFLFFLAVISIISVVRIGLSSKSQVVSIGMDKCDSFSDEFRPEAGAAENLAESREWEEIIRYPWSCMLVSNLPRGPCEVCT